LARQYLGWREKQSSGPAREALRWFYSDIETTQIYLHLMKKPGLCVKSPLDGLG
jgi:hypothetical protein